jgi:hypothetical protein
MIVVQMPHFPKYHDLLREVIDEEHEEASLYDDYFNLLGKLTPTLDDMETAFEVSEHERAAGIEWGEPCAGPPSVDFALVEEDA